MTTINYRTISKRSQHKPRQQRTERLRTSAGTKVKLRKYLRRSVIEVR